MVAGILNSSPSAILTMVARRILPERVLGRRSTTVTSLKAATGPIWRQAFLYESELIPQQTTRQLSLDPTLLVAESVTGGWQSFAEPKVQFELSTFTEPNTFSGYIPPAGSAEDAVAMAEGVVAGLDRKRGEHVLGAKKSVL